MLFQAERLKTLRAMSVAVIHEISQPLSTLAIEARHLREISANGDEEVARGAELIDRKATALSNLVRRLRRFGGRAVDQPSVLPVSSLLATTEALTRPEAKAAGVTLAISPDNANLAIMAQEIELAQALVNLVRNALQACDDGIVNVTVEREGNGVVIAISNHCEQPTRTSEGMGVGMLVARTIIEAHEGRLVRDRRGATQLALVFLPIAEEPL